MLFRSSSDIFIEMKKIKSAQISTVSGDLTLTGNLISDGSVKLSNISGDSYFIVKSALNADILLETGPGGKVVNQYSEVKAEGSFIGSETLKFTAGDGKGFVKMSTVSGKIELSK